MFVIGAVLKLTTWILLIIFCIKRNRHTQHIITYVNSPPIQQPMPFQQTYAAPQQTYAPPHRTAQFPQSPNLPRADYPEMVASSISGTPPPNEANAIANVSRYCAQCGIAVSSRLCPQCGAQS
ncbi:uncharacterized protein N7529_001048 [Penicillium soppii]|uniref:uncharacterized protein n=1 Tax=Penicillium soppii TaxID=69789 RepID=UPI002548C24C|nr:uncharacterized protein N7529_001048 [Penicillium soppii]KAJ5882376.1 hypothetical protein N7529_001048 [Penicillium soppii]